jgi:hypothetical protein
MLASEYLQLLRVANAQYRENTAAIQQQQAAKINEIQQQITWNGGNASLWDYSNGTVVINAQTGNVTSSSVDFGRPFLHKAALVRIVTTVGATPTCTYAINGSMDTSSWTAVSYADYLSPSSFSTSTFVITTAGTVIKYVPPCQPYRYLQVVTSANTNVTNTVDITLLG